MSDEDQGALHTLEVVIVASLMASAVVFVATFEAPPIGSAGVRNNLQQQSNDALAILYDTRLTGDVDALSAYILQCLNGDCSELKRKLDKLLPSGVGYAVYISNGGSTYPVYVAREPAGEAITSRHLIEPSWSHTFLGPGVGFVNPSTDALVVYALPIHKSNPLAQGGSPLIVRVYGTRVGDGADYVLTGAYSTLAYGSADASKAPAASLNFVNATGSAMAVTDLRARTLTGASPSLDPVTFTVRLNESAGVAIPVNTTLTVRIPNGWFASANASWNGANWEVLGNATDYNGSFAGSDIQARLLSPVNASTVDFKFNATYRGDVVDYYPFEAVLSRGPTSLAELLVRADAHGAQPALEVPGIYLSAPKPMGATATTTWTLGALVPDGTNASSSDAVIVSSIEILESNGAAIFGGVQGLQTAGGTWATTGDRLVWTGSWNLTHATPLNLTFKVNASGTAGSSDARAEYIPPVLFDDWTGRATSRVAPGFYRAAFLPATGTAKGYSGDAGVGLYAAHDLTSPGVYRTTSIPGAMSYQSGYASILRDTTHGSYMNISERYVPVGGTSEFTVNIQSAMYELARLGFNPSATLRIHPPWASNTSTPLVTEVLYDGSLLTGAGALLASLDIDNNGVPDPSNFGRFNVTVPSADNWLFGPYVVEVEMNWTDDISQLIGNSTLAESVARSAHIYDYYMVTPPDQLSPPSPIYDVHLVTWFDDWR